MNLEGVSFKPKKTRRLTVLEVAKIKCLLQKYNNKELAAQFSVNISTIWNIRHGITHKWVTEQMARAINERSSY